MNLLLKRMQKTMALTVFIGLLLSTTVFSQETDPFLSVAVLDFETPDPSVKDYGSQLALLVNTHLSMAGNLILVEREELDKLLSEQELGLSGTVDPGTAARIGQLTGAKVLITGRAFKAGNDVVAVARIMSTETSRVYGELVTCPADQPVTDIAFRLSEKIGATLADRAGTLVAHVHEPEDVIAKLKERLAGKELPSISISIPEEHLSRAIADPAAETEIGRILGASGLEILPVGKADVAIAGEAFSESGMRRGNLVSCRARVEVKVTNRTSGKVLLMDRQTEMGIDISESIAAKNALQAAGSRLSERIVEAIVSER